MFHVEHCVSVGVLKKTILLWCGNGLSCLCHTTTVHLTTCQGGASNCITDQFSSAKVHIVLSLNESILKANSDNPEGIRPSSHAMASV